MLARYRRTIYKLTAMLRTLEANPADYKLLLDLQLALLAQIRRTEKRIAVLRQKKQDLTRTKKTARQSKDEAKRTKEKIEAVTQAISNAQYLLFIWRCFGDGIAFLYVNKLALKHMLYNTHDYEMKQSAGSISEKDGFRREWSILKAIVQKDVPAVLSDLTNTIRHGDICVLVGPDPFPIEVKSSKNRNARVERQITSLAALNAFFTTDAAKDFRGLHDVVRVEIPGEHANHAEAMNACIERSKETGFASVLPESGLTYACFRSEESVKHLDGIAGPKTIVTLLNEAKTALAWMPYFPFTLSIREPDALYDFINGDVTLMVLLDTQAVVDAYKAQGLDATFVEHPKLTIVVTRAGAVPGRDPLSGVSTGYFGRLFFDFETIASFVNVELTHLSYLETSSAELQGRIDIGEVRAEDLAVVAWPEFTSIQWLPPQT